MFLKRNLFTKCSITIVFSRNNVFKFRIQEINNNVAVFPNNKVKDLCRDLRISSNTVVRSIAFKYRNKFYCNYFDNIWFEFKAVKDIIIPFEIVRCLFDKSNLKLPAVQMKNKGRLPYKLKIKEYFPIIDPSSRISKPFPIISILGHFDHGKTTILDALGGTSLTFSEPHRITQEVRTRNVTFSSDQNSLPKNKFTFVDTPGQEIFFRMRNYGASVADAVLLVIACDEGICPQTQESIGIVESLGTSTTSLFPNPFFSSSTGLPVVVALNKIDHPSVIANPSRVERLQLELREFTVLAAAPIVPISATKRINLSQLMEALKAVVTTTDSSPSSVPTIHSPTVSHPPVHNKKPMVSEASALDTVPVYLSTVGKGVVLDSWVSRKDGVAVHVVMREGRVAMGDVFSSGGWCGAVRSILHDDNQRIDSAPAGFGVILQLKITVSEDPRPIGDNIHFFRKKDKELALKFTEQRIMSVKLGSHALSPEDVATLRLDRLLLRPKESDSSDWPEDVNDKSLADDDYSSDDWDDEGRNAHIPRTEVDVEGDRDSSEMMDQESDGGPGDDEDDVEDGDGDSTIRFVLKTDTESVLHTVLDALEELTESDTDKDTPINTDGEKQRTLVHSDGPTPARLVRSGVGEVTPQDVLVASAAEAVIITCGVGSDAYAAKRAQDQKVRIVSISKIQDIVDLLRNKCSLHELLGGGTFRSRVHADSVEDAVVIDKMRKM